MTADRDVRAEAREWLEAPPPMARRSEWIEWALGGAPHVRALLTEIERLEDKIYPRMPTCDDESCACCELIREERRRALSRPAAPQEDGDS